MLKVVFKRLVMDVRDYTLQISKSQKALKRSGYYKPKRQLRLNPYLSKTNSPLLSSAVPYPSAMYRPRLQPA